MTFRSAHCNSVLHLLLMPALAIGLVAGCAPASGGGSSGGSSGSNGGSNSGGSSGSNNGGSNSGGQSAKASSSNSNNGGSNNNGGSSATGGSSSSNNGGQSATGGSSSSNNGGSSAAGGNSSSNNGGSNNGGSNNGGSNIGGNSATGGSNNGGSSATGGSGAGGSNPGTNPPGFWSLNEWGVSSPDWHGCSQTGIDIVAGTTTSVKPQDFTTGHNPGDPYCVAGTVFNDYNSVALLGFNISEAATSSSTQCDYNPANATKVGPAGIVPTGSGIAINFSTTSAIDLRIQVQGPNGSTDPTNRWCYDLLGVQSPAFAPYNKFNTKCWVDPSTPAGTAYDGKTPIDAVWFLVPGTKANTTPYSFCINGFAPGNSAADAPKGGTVSVLQGDIGGANTLDANYQRVKVYNSGNAYIIQNNNWGNSGSGQTIHYKDNTFQITSVTGNGSSAPASFPSIYIGENGAIANGLYQTNPGDGLPKQVSTIQSVTTSFAWSGGSGGKDFNATYDVWFSSKIPTAGSYNDAISGFVMVWLYKPGNHQPIGSVQRQATIAGHTWDVWVGPRGTAATGTDGANRPVVSYVAKDSPVSSLSFDLNLFIKDAAANGIQNSWYLTDVFGGFEIWTGSDSTGLQCTGFTCVVK